MEVRADEKWKEGGENISECFSQVECGCGGLEKTRQGMGVKVWHGVWGVNQLVCWEIWGFVVAPALKGYQQIFIVVPTPQPTATPFPNIHAPHLCCFYMFLTKCKDILKSHRDMLAEQIICWDMCKKILSTVINMLNAKIREAWVWSRTLRRAIHAKYTSNIRSVWPQLWQIVLRDFYHE